MATKKPVVRPAVRAALRHEPARPVSARVVAKRPSPPHATPAAPRAPLPAKPSAARTVHERAEELIATVIRLRREIEAHFYELGLALRELDSPEMYRPLGYATFDDLLDERALLSRQQAFKLRQVVDAFDERTAQSLGIEKAYRVIRYTKVAHPARTVTDVLALDPAVRHDSKRIRLSVISARALEAAVRAMQAAARKTPAFPAARFGRATRSLAQVLRHAGVAPERVQTKPRRGKPPIIRIDLSIEEAEDLIALVGQRRRS